MVSVDILNYIGVFLGLDYFLHSGLFPDIFITFILQCTYDK